jgi:hypothetical protein
LKQTLLPFVEEKPQVLTPAAFLFTKLSDLLPLYQSELHCVRYSYYGIRNSFSVIELFVGYISLNTPTVNHFVLFLRR